jgi:hypothetical protein
MRFSGAFILFDSQFRQQQQRPGDCTTGIGQENNPMGARLNDRALFCPFYPPDNRPG